MAGGKRETYRLVEGLAERGHEVDLISYADDTETAAEMEAAAGCTVTTLPGTPDRTPRNLVGNVLSTDPLPVMKARTGRYETEVRRRAREADVLHLHALQTSYLAASLDVATPTVIRFNNVKYEIYRQYARYTRNPAKAAYAYLQYLKTRRFEPAITAAADRTLAITGADRDLLTARGAGGPVEVLPAGVDVDRFAPSDRAADPRTVTFFGSMDYHPNEEAALWFADEVLPRVRDRFDDLTFEIVGKNPSRRVAALGERAGVRVTGFVEDIQDYIERATVVALPIRVGTGIRMKTLHAMAMAKPIVSTSLGVQGIDATDGQHALVAETDRAFASAVERALADADLRERLGRNARALMEVEHDWPTIRSTLEDHYRAVRSSSTADSSDPGPDSGGSTGERR
jgi:glycosyltransferase involved in cell wall biosynthesis